VYQLGRGNEPVTVVGNTLPAVAFNMIQASAPADSRRLVEIVMNSVSRDQSKEGSSFDRTSSSA
jgi:hypothetical protein